MATTRKTKQSVAENKKIMRVSGLVLIASWVAIAAMAILLFGPTSSSYIAGKIGALVFVGIGLLVGSFFIKQSKK